MWWILLGVAVLLLIGWGHTQYALANCMSDAANPASPTHRLASKFGWQKQTLFKLYLARRSMRNNNTTLGMREIRNVMNQGVKDFMEHGPASPFTSPLAIQGMAEEQSMLAMAYAMDAWEEAKSIGDSLKSPPGTAAILDVPPLPSADADDDEALDEDQDEDEDDEDPGMSMAELDRRANRYHQQIDEQVETTHAFLREKFGEVIPSKHSLRTVAVFAVQLSALMAIKRHYPQLHRSTINSLTTALSSRTPNTMPDVKPPPDMFVSYCTIEETVMHRQRDLVEEHGIIPAVRKLLEHLGSNRADHFEMLHAHLEAAAEQARKTYLPFLAEE